MPIYSRYVSSTGTGIQSINGSVLGVQQIVGSGDVTVSTVTGTGVTTVSLGTPLSTFANTSLSNLVAPTAVNAALLGTLGTVTDPAYSFTGDTNTGMWSSGADTLNFSTSGTERMRIRSDGYVSIGGSGAYAKLNVFGSAGLFGTGINLFETSTGDNRRLYIYQDTDKVVYQATYASGGSAHAFNVGNTETMRITNAGNVGIGTTSPGALLTLSSNSSTSQRLDSYNNTANGSDLIFRFARGTESVPTATQNDDVLGFIGARGYGATGPSNASRTSITFNAAETFTNTAQGTYITFGTTPTGSTTIAERMRITAGGNVGINNNNPLARLDVVHDNGIPVRITSATSGNPAGIVFTNPTVQNWSVGVVGSSLSFNSGNNFAGTERMQITNAGAVLIGTDSVGTFTTQTKLRVVSNVNTNTDIVSFNNSQYGSTLYLSAARGTQASPSASLNGDVIGAISARGYGATGFPTGGKAAVHFIATQDWTDSAQGTQVIFRTTPDNSLTTRTPMTITGVGRVLIGQNFTSERPNMFNTTFSPYFQMEGTSNETANLSIVQNSNGQATSWGLSLTKTRATTRGGFSLVSDGDALGGIFFNGSTSTNSLTGAYIQAFVEGTPSDTAMPGRLSFFTNSGSTSNTERMRITSAGNVGIGTTTPQNNLDVSFSVAGNNNSGLTITNTNNNGWGGSVSFAHRSATGEPVLVRSQINSEGGGTNSFLRFLTTTANTVTEKMRIDGDGNVGVKATSFGTSAAAAFGIANGTEPSTSVADQIVMGSVDLTAGNTIPYFRSEGTGMTGAGITNTSVTHKIAIKVNGTVYYLLATTDGT